MFGTRWLAISVSWLWSPLLHGFGISMTQILVQNRKIDSHEHSRHMNMAHGIWHMNTVAEGQIWKKRLNTNKYFYSGPNFISRFDYKTWLLDIKATSTDQVQLCKQGLSISLRLHPNNACLVVSLGLKHLRIFQCAIFCKMFVRTTILQIRSVSNFWEDSQESQEWHSVNNISFSLRI